MVAGEVRNAKVLYLVGTSRLFPKVMSAAVKGPSGVGKSELRKQVVDFFPDEDVVQFTTMSEKALLYTSEDFAHKILSMGEALSIEEQSLQDVLMRQLISEGRLIYPTVQKIGNAMETVTITKDGPVTFLVTTTRHSLDPELETRLLSLEVDDSAAQTREVLRKVASVESGTAPDREHDLMQWQAFQRWLRAGDTAVSVPFAAQLAEATSNLAVRLRRDFGQLLRAAKAHALLHREHRERDEDGLIVAEIHADYGAVRELLADVIAHTAGLSASPPILETVKAVTDLDTGGGVAAAALGKHLKLDKSTAWRRLAAAAAEGYVVNIEERRGRPGRYKPSPTAPDNEHLLPTAGDLHAAVYPPSEKPSDSVQPCNQDQKAEEQQEVSGCAPGCTPEDASRNRATATAADSVGTGCAIGNGEDRVQPAVQPLNPCAASVNVDRLHGCTDFEGVAEGGIPSSGNGAGPCVICGKPLAKPMVQTPDGLAHYTCADQPPPTPPKKSRIKRPRKAEHPA
jgi:hypothetical protein